MATTQPTPTQSRHPWRATLRTAAAVVIALVPVVPQLVDHLGLSAYGWAATAVAIAATVTRIMAIPAVNDLLRKVLPFLAADPKAEPLQWAPRARG